MTDHSWWQSGVIYQVYPRSFCDRSGDGVGDLAGIRAHLDHLVWLGVDALWLSPVYPSPMADFGYDVSDYCDIDPVFGSLAEFDRLVDEAHSLGLKVVLDWVPNHTSDRHPWFVSSRSSRTSPHRDWYIWRPAPNNWKAAFPGVGRTEFPPAWTEDPATGEWYLHLFLAEQPDLNWANPAVRSAMADTLRFWLERGVDGFRVDAIQCLGKDPALPDLPPERAPIPMSAQMDDPRTQTLVTEIRSVIKHATPDAVAIGETFVRTTRQVASYYGRPDAPGLDLAFDFRPLWAAWDATVWRREIDSVLTEIAPVGWPAWVLGNHDNRRARTRYGSEDRARAAAVLLLTQMGTPFLYAGEELGLADAVVPPDRQVDPGGRDGCRAPIPWTPDPGHGWEATPWLPWPPEADAGRDVQSMAGRPGSTLDLYRRLLAARRASPALSVGRFEWLPAAEPVLLYRRHHEGDERVVAVNFSPDPVEIELPPGSWDIEVGTHEPGPVGVAGRLGLRGDEAVVLRLVSRGTGGPSAPRG